jgi:hypothetical protein
VGPATQGERRSLDVMLADHAGTHRMVVALLGIGTESSDPLAMAALRGVDELRRGRSTRRLRMGLLTPSLTMR